MRILLGCAFFVRYCFAVRELKYMKLNEKALLLLHLSPKFSFISSKLIRLSGFPSSLLGIESNYSLLSRAASVTVFVAFANLKIALFIRTSTIRGCPKAMGTLFV